MRTSTVNNRALALALMSAYHGTNHFYLLVLPAGLPQIVAEFSLSHLNVGLLVGSFALPYAVTMAPIGHLAHRVNRLFLLAAGTIGFALSLATMSITHNFTQLLLLQLVAGVCGATYHPVGATVIYEAFSQERRGMALGFHQTGGALGSFVAPIVTGFLALAFGWRNAFILLSILGIAISTASLFILSTPKATLPERVKFLDAVRNRNLILMTAGVAIASAAFQGLGYFATLLMKEDFNLPIVQAAVFLALLQVGGIVSGPIFGRLSDAIGRKQVLLSLAMVTGVALYLITISSLVALYVIFLVIGISVFALFAVSEAYLADIIAPKLRGTSYGFYISTTWLVIAALPPAFGYVVDTAGFRPGFVLLSLLTFAAVPFFLAISSKVFRPVQN